eukprot:TRINITY_DN11062_c0_g2_i1.p1 TRINITY_DN11062_c0_g2~~TRINITY_DN11062_c0_g2_i1.p1  ORF type:complete len:404 (-),score=42.60 TRINITY_DN11062_c0_g2_i1:239-1450(-)
MSRCSPWTPSLLNTNICMRGSVMLWVIVQVDLAPLLALMRIDSSRFHEGGHILPCQNSLAAPGHGLIISNPGNVRLQELSSARQLDVLSALYCGSEMTGLHRYRQHFGEPSNRNASIFTDLGDIKADLFVDPSLKIGIDTNAILARDIMIHVLVGHCEREKLVSFVQDNGECLKTTAKAVEALSRCQICPRLDIKFNCTFGSCNRTVKLGPEQDGRCSSQCYCLSRQQYAPEMLQQLCDIEVRMALELLARTQGVVNWETFARGDPSHLHNVANDCPRLQPTGALSRAVSAPWRAACASASPGGTSMKSRPLRTPTNAFSNAATAPPRRATASAVPGGISTTRPPLRQAQPRCGSTAARATRAVIVGEEVVEGVHPQLLCAPGSRAQPGVKRCTRQVTTFSSM